LKKSFAGVVFLESGECQFAVKFDYKSSIAQLDQGFDVSLVVVGGESECDGRVDLAGGCFMTDVLGEEKVTRYGVK
jgi:hypothetical protein